MNDIVSIGSSMGKVYNKPKQHELDMFIEDISKWNVARDYLKTYRNLNDETIKNFNLGFDYYRNQIAIPEYKNGELVNIGFRSLDKEPQVKYTKERGCENWIFNEEALELAKKNQSILICSNQFDAMSAWQAGFKSVVSVPVGKDAIGLWMELLKSIPRIYISFEATVQMKKFGIGFADRLGTDKCFEVKLPDEVIDLCSYFKQYTAEDFKQVLKEARPYYKYTYTGLSDIITSLRDKKDDDLTISCLPFVSWKDGFTAVMSGVTNVGKTSVALNVANELASRDIPVLCLVIERSIEDSGERFLQIRYKETKDSIKTIPSEKWDFIAKDTETLPLYFANTNIKRLEEIIVKSKTLFNTKFVIIDHLDKLIRNSSAGNYIVEQAFAIGEIVKICQENNIMALVLHHIKKQEGVSTVPKKPSLNDLKGSGSIKDDPEAVIMLSIPDRNQLEVDILKNKGPMGSRIYEFDTATGVIGRYISFVPELLNEKQKVQMNFDKF
jgi:hypothetical protein